MSLRSRVLRRHLRPADAQGREGGADRDAQALVAQAAGTVLEIGGGTGANLGHYRPAVTSLTITEPDVADAQAPRAPRAVPRRPRRMVLRAPAEDLPFEDDTFDMVVSTLVLCGVDDQPRAVREIRRVLRPGAGCSSSSTCGPTIPRRRRSRTG